MKRFDLLVLFTFATTISFDWAAYMVLHNQQLHPDKGWLIFFCAILSFSVVVVTFVHFQIINIRVSGTRIQMAWKCFKSYFSKETIKELGIIKSIIYAFYQSHFFFLKSFHP